MVQFGMDEMDNMDIEIPQTEENTDYGYEEVLAPISTKNGDPLPHRCRQYIWNPVHYDWKPHQLAEWHQHLGLVIQEVVKKTFMATTQFVPSVQHENELFPKQPQGARFPVLSCMQINKAAYCDIVELPLMGRQKVASKGLLFYTS